MRLLLAGGGTGGHLVPGIAVAQAARARGDDVLFITAGRPVEDRILTNWPRRALPLERGAGAPGWLTIAARAPRAIAAARGAIRDFRADVLLGLGGLASFPAVLAARWAGIPAALLEINAVAGRSTRLLAPFAARIFVVSPRALEKRYHHKCLATGAPLRAGFDHLPTKEDARAAFHLDPALATVLALGGSQGAAAVNRAVAAILYDLAALPAQILWIAGPEKDAQARAAASAVPGLRAAIFSYIEETPLAYAAGDLAVCRAGAATVAELAAAGLPAIAIPYPHHRDRQQCHNAALLGEGAIVIDEALLSPSALMAPIRDLLQNRERRARMARASSQFAKPLAAAEILRDLARLANCK